MSRVVSEHLNQNQRRKFLFVEKWYYWDEPYFFQEHENNIIRIYAPESLINKISKECDAFPTAGHYGGIDTTSKVLLSGNFWPSLYHDAYAFVKHSLNINFKVTYLGDMIFLLLLSLRWKSLMCRLIS